MSKKTSIPPSQRRAATSTSKEAQDMDALIEELAGTSRSPVALVLGAGASKPFGYPLTRELMFRIFAELRYSDSEENKNLYKFLCTLLPGERASPDKLPLVTGVLSLLDYALATGQGILPGITLEQTRRSRELLERAVLESIPDWEYFSENEQHNFDKYCSWLKTLKATRPKGGLGLITTNYDMLADNSALEAAGVKSTGEAWNIKDMGNKVDFGFRWIRPDLDDEVSVARPDDAVVALYKLHGSTNWLRCPLCENLYISPNGPIFWNAADEEASDANCCHCSATRLQAQIVSPSFVRQMHEPNLISIWKNALDFLRRSDDWVVIGYSFPDEDVAVRALFTRAFSSRRKPPRIRVVQWDGAAEINYKSFFQTGSLKYLTGGLNLLLERYALQQRKVRSRSARETHEA